MAPFRDSSTVEQRTLNPLILVRIQVPEPKKEKTMAKEKKYPQSSVYEFSPKEDLTTQEIVELLTLIRIGISGELIEKASPALKKHFVEIKK